MRSIKLLLPLCLLAGTTHAVVRQPAEGVWRFETSNGSGLTLDVRDTTIGVGIYTYDEDGDSVWYSGAGQLVDGVVVTSVALYRETAPGTVEAVGEAQSLRIAFSTSTQGTLALDGSAPLAIEQLAFGADYVSGWNPLGSNDQPLPDLRGRWLFATRSLDGTDQVAAHDIEFAASSVSQDGRVASFHSVDYPVDGAPDATRRYTMDCGPLGTPPATVCTLASLVTPLATGESPQEIGRFDPRDLSANRAVGAVWGGEVFGFRMPANVEAAPQPGIWQIRGRNGSGMTLDVRENGAAVGIFSYDDAGNAIWWLAQGQIVSNTLAAPLVRFEEGSCLACPQADPTPAATRQLQIHFISTTRALLTLDEGEAIPLVLLPYGAEYASAPVAGDPLEVDFGVHAVPLLSGDWVFSQGDVATQRASDNAIALDFIANTAIPSAQAPYADRIGAQASDIARTDLSPEVTERWALDCAPTGEVPNATCELLHLAYPTATPPSPVPPPTMPLAIAPVSDLTATRYLAVGTGDSEFGVPVWGFRLPSPMVVQEPQP